MPMLDRRRSYFEAWATCEKSDFFSFFFLFLFPCGQSNALLEELCFAQSDVQ